MARLFSRCSWLFVDVGVIVDVVIVVELGASAAVVVDVRADRESVFFSWVFVVDVDVIADVAAFVDDDAGVIFALANADVVDVGVDDDADVDNHDCGDNHDCVVVGVDVDVVADVVAFVVVVIVMVVVAVVGGGRRRTRKTRTTRA